MWLQADKKGLSIIIGYVLLIVISIVMSIIVFQFLKNYVPKDVASCPEGTSVFIRDVSYNCTENTLAITLKNNGKFSVDGYFIHVSNQTEGISTIDLSSKILSGGNISGNSVIFSLMTQNSLTPDEPTNVKLVRFNVSGLGALYKVEIIPTRIQEDTRKRVVSCGDAKVQETLACSE
jgi:hypothetical protein